MNCKRRSAKRKRDSAQPQGMNAAAGGQ